MNISYKWIGGATWILRIDTITIACDPVLCPEGHIQDYTYFKTRRLNDPTYDESEFKKVNLWLLTHNHEDHIDAYGFKIINKDSPVVSHNGLKRSLKNDTFNDLRFLRWQEDTAIQVDGFTIKIKAVPAIHAKRKLFGSLVGNGNGYLLEISKNGFKFRIYVTGDSVYDKSIHKHIGSSPIDLIIANSGSAMVGKSILSYIIGRITNNISDIIAMNSDLKPKMLIPVHWGTFSHYSEIINRESFSNHGNIRFINPGESITIS